MSAVLSPSLMARLANFKLSSKGLIRGSNKGARRSGRLGTSLEFSDYRLYSPGDDPRQIDWNTYARTNKHYIKRFMDERELTVNVIIDCTKSMAFNEVKWRRVKALASAFALMSLSGQDRLAVYPVASATAPYPLSRGKALAHQALSYIAGITPNETGERFAPYFYDAVTKVRPGGLSVVISDLSEDPKPVFGAVKRLQAKRQDVRLLQVLLPEEAAPDYSGDVKLTDAESGAERDVSMSRNIVERYRERFEAHTRTIESFCRRRGVGYLSCFTTEALEKTIFSTFTANGWIN